MTSLLADRDVDRALAELPGWVRLDGRLLVALESPDFPAAVRLIEAIAHEAEELDHHPDLQLRSSRVVCAVSTHSLGGLTDKDLALARRIVDVARQLGAVPAPPLAQVVRLRLDCTDVDAVAPFWATALQLTPRAQDQGEPGRHLADESGSLELVLTPAQAAAPGGRMHLSVEVPISAASDRVGAALSNGGQLRDASHAPAWWTLLDAEGNELCVCTDAAQAHRAAGV
jgi:4a-hydroxytetrahydrobiopterin dehydratase